MNTINTKIKKPLQKTAVAAAFVLLIALGMQWMVNTLATAHYNEFTAPMLVQSANMPVLPVSLK